MKTIAIIGTVGIPAKYGGFETLSEYLTGLLRNKVAISVYCSSKAYTKKQKTYNQASLIYIPLSANGMQSIPYDLTKIISKIEQLMHDEKTYEIFSINALEKSKQFRKKIMVSNIENYLIKRT